MWQKKHYIGQADDNSLLQPTKAENGCCPDTSGTMCKYTIAATFGNPIESITVDSVVKAFAANATDIDELITEVRAIMRVDHQEVESVGTRKDGDNLIVITDSVIAGITPNGQSIINATAECTEAYVCKYRIGLVGAIGTVAYNGSTSAVAGGPFDYTAGDDAANATVAGNLQTALGTAFTAVSLGHSVVAVTVNNVTESFDVVVTAPVGRNVTIGNVALTQDDCEKDYTA